MKSFYIFLLLFLFGAESTVHSQKTNTDAGHGQINSFVYHRFGDNRYPSTNISVEDFRKHLGFLKKNNYHVVTLGNALDLLDKNELPEKTVVLTVDDGYKSFYENAMPLLREFDFPATLFINTQHFGTGDFLSVQQIMQLMNEGIEIGNHSHSHAHFVSLPKKVRLDSFRNDIYKSQQVFKELFGIQPEIYAYPYGEYTQGMQQVLEECGIKSAAAQKSGVIAPFSDPFALPRFPMAGPFTNIDRFREKARMKAMPAKPVTNVSPVLEENNPPQLTLHLFKPGLINTEQVQFFAGGVKQSNVEIDDEKNTISIKADLPLKSRRTLYTITAPSRSIPLEWYWYSFMWVNPDADE